VTPTSAREPRGDPGIPASRFDLDWIRFGEAYRAVQETQEKSESDGTVAARVAELVASHLMGGHFEATRCGSGKPC
jgi:hypothetical protein